MPKGKKKKQRTAKPYQEFQVAHVLDSPRSAAGGKPNETPSAPRARRKSDPGTTEKHHLSVPPNERRRSTSPDILFAGTIQLTVTPKPNGETPTVSDQHWASRPAGTFSGVQRSLQFNPTAETSVMNVPGIGKKLRATLQEKGFKTVRDLQMQMKTVYMDWLQTLGAGREEQEAIYNVVKGLDEGAPRKRPTQKCTEV